MKKLKISSKFLQKQSLRKQRERLGYCLLCSNLNKLRLQNSTAKNTNSDMNTPAIPFDNWREIISFLPARDILHVLFVSYSIQESLIYYIIQHPNIIDSIFWYLFDYNRWQAY